MQARSRYIFILLIIIREIDRSLDHKVDEVLLLTVSKD